MGLGGFPLGVLDTLSFGPLSQNTYPKEKLAGLGGV
jgi:hypothetical protein